VLERGYRTVAGKRGKDHNAEIGVENTSKLRPNESDTVLMFIISLAISLDAYYYQLRISEFPVF
jgi:hypothetical protein